MRTYRFLHTACTTFCIVALTAQLTPIPAAHAQVTPLGEAFDVNTYTTGSQDGPSVSIASNGEFVIVWNSDPRGVGTGQDGSVAGVFGQRFDASGDAVGGEFQVNTYTTSFQLRPRVHAAPAGGSFVVLYTGYGDQDGSASGVFGRTFADDAPVEPLDVQVNTFTTGFQIAGPVVFVEGSAGAASNLGAGALLSGELDTVLVYEGLLADDADGGIGARREAGQGASGPNQAEFAVNSYTTGSQSDPDACADAQGNLVVVWGSEVTDGDSQDGSERGMFARRFDANADPIGPEFQVNSYTTGSQAFGEVCCAADGSFLVAWADLDGRDGNFQGVFARRFDSNGSALGDDFQVNVTTQGSQGVPSLACAQDGSAFVVWQGLGQPLRGRAYDSTGVAITDEVEVADASDGIPQQPTVAMTGDGRMVVAWHKRGVDGDDSGVRARRYRLAVGVGGTTTTTVAAVTTTSIPPTTIVSVTTSSTTTTSTTTTTTSTTTTTLGSVTSTTSGGGSTSTSLLVPVGCGDAVTDGSVTASDALAILRTAVGISFCLECRCDIDGSGTVTATDALTALRIAVGQPGQLLCPPCDG